MDSRTQRLAALTLAAVAMACARARTNEVGISDSATAATAVRSDSTVATTTRTDTTRRDTMAVRTDTAIKTDTSVARTDTTRSTAAGEVSLGMASAADASVARLISTIDRAEIEEARLVMSKTQNNDIRTFAQQMVDDHSASATVVDPLAKSATMHMDSSMSRTSTDTTKKDSTSMSTTPSGQGIDAAIAQLESAHQRSMETLRGLSGAEFDKAYAQGQIDDHQQVLTLLRQYGSNVNNATLKAHVADFTSKVSEHLEKARTLQRSIASN